MEAYEDILPENETIDKKVELHREALEVKFRTSIALSGDILDIDYEHIHPTEKFLEFSSAVAKSLISDDDPQAVRDAVYRSICFGSQLSDYLLADKLSYNYNLLKYVKERIVDVPSIVPIVEDSSQYLDMRPHLSSLFTDHMSDIDRVGGYDNVVEIFGGIVVMLAERSIGRQYADTSIQGLDTRDFQ